MQLTGSVQRSTRAPAAAAFYRATSTERLDVRLRRHLISRGRTVVGLEDDVLDQSVLEDGDHDVVLQGVGAQGEELPLVPGVVDHVGEPLHLAGPEHGHDGLAGGQILVHPG